ncbi:hypothetical protein NEOLEDRAFT_1128961 [Neolentinus lepideus HHB14362 ss-1]|uniref:EF-hand domain-containing protein n=1 Tax=Neolentinus lepideus HHB14362 ss-1 TaxID=1314782 RepID=A0A165UVB4_9AGAM|nr:hypothetical protein NEOLEDRAFT_1128961 [Neolentinus lepideus HHB14362 ss-1]
MDGTARNAEQEEVPLSNVSRPKEYDFAAARRSDENSTWKETTGKTIEVPLDDDGHDTHDADSASDTTATNSSDEFDWDEGDDEEREKESGEKTKARRGRAIWLAFMQLSRFVRVLLAGILGAGVLIAPLLIVEFRFRSSIARPHVHMWSLWLSIIWAVSCATYLIVDYVPKLFMWLIVLFGGSIARLQTQIELTLAVAAWLKLALDITWAWISLSILRATYHPPGSYWVTINRVMQALFASGIILLVEKIFLRFVAINFHQKALAERLTENRLGLKALDRLSNAQPSVYRRVNYGRRGHKSPGSVPQSAPPTRRNSLDLLGLHTKFGGHGKNSVPSSPVTSSPVEKEKGKGGHHVHIHGEKKAKTVDVKARRRKAIASVVVDQVSGAIGQVALKNSKLNKDVGSLYSARKLARKLFSALSYADPPRDYLLVDDFYPYFPSTAEAQAAFAIFDKDGNGDITKKEMREAVQRIYRERKSLVSSLKDVGSVVAKLDAVLITIALVIIFFICLLIFNRKDTLSSLVPLATIILGFSFIFGHSAQLLFESLIFIFSTHVFDVGDLVMIDDQPLFVREFGLFSTTFRRVDGQEIIAPNALLASAKLVHNMRRSNSMWESTDLMVAYNTPLDAIEQLRQRINTYVQQHNRDWSGCGVHIDKMEYQNAIYLIIAMEHRPNWQDWGGRWGRRTEFMRFLKTTLEELDLRYTMPVQPVLMPRNSPYGNNGNSSSNLNLPRGLGRMASRDAMGNAGSFQGSEFMLRAPTRSINSDTNVFRRVDGL